MSNSSEHPAESTHCQTLKGQPAGAAKDAPPSFIAPSLATLFMVIQIMGIPIAVVVATIEIESIVFTGPIFSLAGGVAAVLAWRQTTWSRIAFGSSAPAISLICFLTIFLQRWSPDDAAQPISALLILYESLLLPVGLLGFHQTVLALTPLSRTSTRQFSLRALLVGVCTTCVAFALGRAVLHGEQPLRTAIAGVICGATFVAMMAICLVIGLRSQQRSGYDSDSSVSGICDSMLDSSDRQCKGCEL